MKKILKLIGFMAFIAIGITTVISCGDNDSNVIEKVMVKKITITPTRLSKVLGDKPQLLKVVIEPKNATNKSVKWETSNAKVVTVDQKGNVTFKATGKAMITATAQDGSGKSDKCELTVLKGGKLVTNIDEIDFGTVYVGDTVKKDLTITNNGNSDVKITDFNISGSSWAKVDASTPTVIKPGKSIRVSIVFKPTVPQSWRKPLEIKTEKANNIVVKLRAKIVLKPAKIDLRISSVSFGEIKQNTSKEYMFTIGNKGVENLKGNIVVVGDSSFKISPANFNISKGGSKRIKVTFKPTSKGAKEATLKIISNGGDKQVSLSGRGKAEPGKLVFTQNNEQKANARSLPTKENALLFLSDDSVYFNVELKNIGDTPVTVKSIVITDAKVDELKLVCNTSANFTVNGKALKNLNFTASVTSATNKTNKWDTYTITIKTQDGQTLTYISWVEKDQKLSKKVTKEFYQKVLMSDDKSIKLFDDIFTYRLSDIDKNGDKIVSVREAKMYKGHLQIPKLANYDDYSGKPLEYFPNITSLDADFRNGWAHLKFLKNLRSLLIRGPKYNVGKAMWENSNRVGVKGVKELVIHITDNIKTKLTKQDVPSVTKLSCQGYIYPTKELSEQLVEYVLYGTPSDNNDETENMGNLQELTVKSCNNLTDFYLPPHINSSASNVKVKVENCHKANTVYAPNGVNYNNETMQSWGITASSITLKHY